MATGGVRGDLIQWARSEQQLTMRWVRDGGGPSPAYQSEVENLKKSEPNPEVFRRWIRILNITEEFARGQISRYHLNPGACRGLAADIVPLVHQNRARLSVMSITTRTAEVLRMVARNSKRLPRLVLAYVLGLSLMALDEMMAGVLPIPSLQVAALSNITTIPEVFLLTGEGSIKGAPVEEFFPAIDLARSAGITGMELLEIVRSALSRRSGGGISPSQTNTLR